MKSIIEVEEGASPADLFSRPSASKFMSFGQTFGLWTLIRPLAPNFRFLKEDLSLGLVVLFGASTGCGRKLTCSWGLMKCDVQAAAEESQTYSKRSNVVRKRTVIEKEHLRMRCIKSSTNVLWEVYASVYGAPHRLFVSWLACVFVRLLA